MPHTKKGSYAKKKKRTQTLSQAAQAIFGQLLHLERQKPVTIYPNNDKYKSKKIGCVREQRGMDGKDCLLAGWTIPGNGIPFRLSNKRRRPDWEGQPEEGHSQTMPTGEHRGTLQSMQRGDEEAQVLCTDTSCTNTF